jgi:hypothetical protein
LPHQQQEAVLRIPVGESRLLWADPADGSPEMLDCESQRRFSVLCPLASLVHVRETSRTHVRLRSRRDPMPCAFGPCPSGRIPIVDNGKSRRGALERGPQVSPGRSAHECYRHGSETLLRSSTPSVWIAGGTS